MPPDVIALFGPTGVGKTAVADALAERLRGRGEDPVLISADALQVYRGLEILTGAEPRHRLVGVLPVEETFSAGQYARLAHAEIDAARAAGRRAIVVGGTGLYLRAALAELDLRPPPDPAIRRRLTDRARTEGSARLHGELPAEVAARIEPGDTQRIVRALELLEAGHAPPAGEQLWSAHTRVPTRLFALVMEREALYAKIDARVDAMVAAGAGEEVRRAAARASPTARKALGFEHLLAGNVDGMKRDTRRYARRQLTWLRKLPDVTTIDVTGRDPGDVAAQIAS